MLAGSPLRLFRLTPAGALVAERLERGNEVDESTLIDRLLDAGAIHPTSPPARPTRYTMDDLTVVTPQLGGSVRRDGRITVDDGSMPALGGASLRLERNAGPAAARNAARPLVDTSLVAFLDADVTTTTDPRARLNALLWHFDDPLVGLVAPRVRGEIGSPLDMGEQPARIRAGTRVSYVPGAAIVVRRDALDRVGWFDEGLRFGEDVDLVWRLDEAGWRCRFDPSVAVWHEPRRTWSARLRQHAGYGTSAAPLALRHPGALSPLHVNGWTVGAWVLVALGQWVPAGVVMAGSSVALVGKLPDLPPTTSVLLAMKGHLAAVHQIMSAVRRVWWPIVIVGATVSKRVRLLAVVAVLSSVRSAPTDAAYGWGVWTSMQRLRTWAPIIPRLSAWPARPTRPSRQLPDATGRPGSDTALASEP